MSETIPHYNPSYTVTQDSLFHDVVLHLAYNQGYEKNDTVKKLSEQLQAVLEEVGAKRDALRANVEPQTYGITLLEVGEHVASVQAAHVTATIVNAAQEFAEFVTMDLTPHVELEPGEEHFTSEEITAKVMFAMVIGSEYNLGKLGRDKSFTP